jgi:hypothetical protein
MTKMGLAPIYQQAKTSEPHPWHIHRYLLRHLTIETPKQVWRADARRGLCYAGRRGIARGVVDPEIHLGLAAKLSRKSGPHQLTVPSEC